MTRAPLTAEAARAMHAIHRRDIYAGFAPLRPMDLQGWNGGHPALSEAVEAARPRIVVDLGVWKGQSVVTLAGAVRRHAPGGCVIAVDTFLGSPEHWNPDRADGMMDSLLMTHGWPGLYWQFLSNVVHAGVSDTVVPLPQTGENAAVILKRLRLRPGVVHVDAAHEYEAVLRDARAWWALLEPGGILLGDDFAWPGVERAARGFAAEVGQPLEVRDPKWILRKPR